MINELRRRRHPDEYLYIRAWGHLMGTYDSIVDQRVEHARAAGAPADTIYRNHAGEWVTVGELASAETREILRNYAQLAGGVRLPAPTLRTPRCEALAWRMASGLGTCDWPLNSAGVCEWAAIHLSEAIAARNRIPGWEGPPGAER